MIRRAVAVALLTAALSLGFFWGFLSHRQRAFPFDLLRSVGIHLGLLRGDTAQAVVASGSAQPWRIDIPYLDAAGTPGGAGAGVLQVDPGRVAPGWTLVSDADPRGAAAVLLRRDGSPAWTWRLPEVKRLHLATVRANGDLVAVDVHQSVVCVDREGKPRWVVPGRFHHAATAVSGGTLTLRTRSRVIPAVHPVAQVIDEEVVLLDEAGREQMSISVADALLDSPYAFLLPALSDREILDGTYGRELAEMELELFHANHVEPTDPRSRPGSRLPPGYLVSIRNLNLLALIDASSRRVVWVWGPGRLELQHHPTVLPSGNLLVFNNGRTHSEVLELDALTRRVVWSYHAEGFFSAFGGSSQRLQNGNTLITASASGLVFEVTPAGETVWEWAHPRMTDDGRRQTLYRATHYQPEELPFLAP